MIWSSSDTAYVDFVHNESNKYLCFCFMNTKGTIIKSIGVKREVCAIIRFLHMKKLSAYYWGMGKMWWCWEILWWPYDIHEEDCSSGWPSLVTDELMQYVNEKVHINRHFTLSTLNYNFPEISWTILYEVGTEKLLLHDNAQ